MGRRFDIPWVGGPIYHGNGGRYTMARGVNIPWVWGRYPMCRGSICHRKGFKMLWIKGSIYIG